MVSFLIGTQYPNDNVKEEILHLVHGFRMTPRQKSHGGRAWWNKGCLLHRGQEVDQENGAREEGCRRREYYEGPYILLRVTPL